VLADNIIFFVDTCYNISLLVDHFFYNWISAQLQNSVFPIPRGRNRWWPDCNKL